MLCMDSSIFLFSEPGDPWRKLPERNDEGDRGKSPHLEIFFSFIWSGHPEYTVKPGDSITFEKVDLIPNRDEF